MSSSKQPIAFKVEVCDICYRNHVTNDNYLIRCKHDIYAKCSDEEIQNVLAVLKQKFSDGNIDSLKNQIIEFIISNVGYFFRSPGPATIKCVQKEWMFNVSDKILDDADKIIKSDLVTVYPEELKLIIQKIPTYPQNSNINEDEFKIVHEAFIYCICALMTNDKKCRCNIQCQKFIHQIFKCSIFK